MIGVWAITLTTGLSIGLRDTLIQAINSRPEARFLQIYKTSATEFAFTDFNSIPKFEGISEADIEDLKADNPEIVSALPSIAGRFAVRGFDTPDSLYCNTLYNQLGRIQSQTTAQSLNSAADPSQRIDPSTFNPEDIANFSALQQEYSNNCVDLLVTRNDFDYLYNINRSNWYGQTEEPTGNQIVLCYTCGSVQLAQQLGVDSPEDLLGREIGFELIEAPEQYVFEGEEYDIIAGTGRPISIEQENVTNFEVVAVVDDSQPGLSVGFSNAYIPPDYFLESIRAANPEAENQEPLFVEYSLFVEDFSQLEEVTDSINDREGYLATALVLILVSAINNLFLGLTVVLSMLGFIAFVASIFGIITVMFISVLERKKEIGVLKSLGARDRDIFLQFLFESGLLGVVGWMFGMLLAIATSLLIQLIVSIAINNIDGLKDGLAVLNIDGFAPVFPWWIYPTTFALAVFFTSVSGIVPSFSAARQNPVEVLRSE